MARNSSARYAPALEPVLSHAAAAAPTLQDLSRRMQATAVELDWKAFTVVFRYFAPRVKSYLMRGSGADGLAESLAEELAQETMILVWRKATLFDPSRARLSTWIFTIARNLRVDYLRGQRSLIVDNDSDDEVGQDIPDLTPGLEEQLYLDRRERLVRDALSQLSQAQAQVLRLSFYENLPHTDIARALNIPLGTVKSRLRLAVNHLRQILDPPDT
jgi:RNA polymerase sigma factor (sigma-70 family)